MERHEVLELMGQLKLSGMKAAGRSRYCATAPGAGGHSATSWAIC